MHISQIDFNDLMCERVLTHNIIALPPLGN